MLIIAYSACVLASLYIGFICGSRHERRNLEAQMESLQDECSRRMAAVHRDLKTMRNLMQITLGVANDQLPL
jgi:hypothetical protein